MAGDVITFGAGGTAVLPLAGKTKIVCALAADVVVAEVVVEGFGVRKHLVAVDPLATVGGIVVLRRLGGLGGLLELVRVLLRLDAVEDVFLVDCGRVRGGCEGLCHG